MGLEVVDKSTAEVVTHRRNRQIVVSCETMTWWGGFGWVQVKTPLANRTGTRMILLLNLWSPKKS